MKTTKRMIALSLAIAVIVSFAACKSSPSEMQGSAASARISSQAEQAADDFRIVDWKDRSIGEIASPIWLYPAVRGNWSRFKEEWPVGQDKVLKIGATRHARLNSAQTIADVQYAARLAAQLKQSVLTRAAISLGTQGEFDAVNDVAVQTKVDIAGQERLTDFWQLIETTGQDGRKTRVYIYWVVYACDSAVWDQLVAKYLFDITGKIPDTRTQRTIAAMFDEINAETKIERERSQAIFEAELAARQKALQEPMSQAEIRVAYRSNDPAQRAAAATTSADTDYVAALRALAATNQ